MSDETTTRLGLPMIEPGQAQKEMSHNEALALLDLLVQPVVLQSGRNTPPTDPEPGEAWIVGTAPTGAWADRAGAVAGWTTSGWRFVPPTEGMTVWVTGSAGFAQFSAGIWDVGVVCGTTLQLDGLPVVGPRHGAIADITGGTTIDSEARAAIAAILGAMRGHGLIAD